MSFSHFARALVLLLAMLAAAARAHDVPADIRIVAFVKPEGQHLVLLMRVPLSAVFERVVPAWKPVTDGFVESPAGQDLLRYVDGRIREGACAYDETSRWTSKRSKSRAPQLSRKRVAHCGP